MNSPTNLAALKMSKAAKEALLNGALPRGTTHESKRRAAIAWLGKKYVCHKVNRVTKLTEPLPDVYDWRQRGKR